MTATTFKLAKLIEATEASIASLQAELDDHESRVKAYHDNAKANWVRINKPRLKKARDLLSRALRGDGVITSRQVGDINKLLYSTTSEYVVAQSVHSPASGSRAAIVNRIAELKTSLATLQALDGDEITVSQLRMAGVNKLPEIFGAPIIEKKRRGY